MTKKEDQDHHASLAAVHPPASPPPCDQLPHAEHGTTTRYSRGCKCRLCKDAHNSYRKNRRDKSKVGDFSWRVNRPSGVVQAERMARRANPKGIFHKPNPSRDAEAVRMLQSGMSDGDVARKIGLTPRAFRALKQRCGVSHGKIGRPAGEWEPLTYSRALLVSQNLDLVQKLARYEWRRTGRHDELDEYISTGSLGLVKAASRFKERQNGSFRKMAATYIVGAIKDWRRQDMRFRGFAFDGKRIRRHAFVSPFGVFTNKHGETLEVEAATRGDSSLAISGSAIQLLSEAS